ncbi:hypothetical protein [Nocardioides sp. Leaf374]|uniref:hypothetical protein n=1 Tax=Nocardioides sp. Leaf374 TaxID=2876560 RepID=UPI001E4AE05F|nr:hypothetical protein [Nocardioides sp. Leaf374]
MSSLASGPAPDGPHEPDAGAVRGRRRGVGWRQVAHGVHVPVSAGDDEELAAWLLLVPPSGGLTHLTGAAARGWSLPPLPAGLPVLVCMGRGGVRPARPGLRTIRLARPRVEAVRGLRVAPALDVLLACACDLALLDLVVLVDAALREDASCLDGLADLTGRRGLPALRRAAALADAGAESAWESVLRVLHHVCGAEVASQHEVRDDSGLVARGDLWLVGTTVLHEYDGAHHREAPQHADDLRRDRRLARAGWSRRAYTSGDLVARPGAVVRDVDLALGREHDPATVRAWTALLRASCFTPAGRQRLVERLASSPVGRAAVRPVG